MIPIVIFSMMGLSVKKLLRSMMNYVHFFPPNCKEKVKLKCSVMPTSLSKVKVTVTVTVLPCGTGSLKTLSLRKLGPL